ncbi:hypothetical protein [Rhodoligotrophos defluvii]|uniref:hypothetical protein n=1 Tax=Rhodoligotrophos defluvii TaxID=2561934 RepID=UPI0010C9F034|nr:hypothetical protein [Rhodoligotrophos defluvii]
MCQEVFDILAQVPETPPEGGWKKHPAGAPRAPFQQPMLGQPGPMPLRRPGAPLQPPQIGPMFPPHFFGGR